MLRLDAEGGGRAPHALLAANARKLVLRVRGAGYAAAAAAAAVVARAGGGR